jgi:hypothetical protein
MPSMWRAERDLHLDESDKRDENGTLDAPTPSNYCAEHEGAALVV